MSVYHHQLAQECTVPGLDRVSAMHGIISVSDYFRAHIDMALQLLIRTDLGVRRPLLAPWRPILTGGTIAVYLLPHLPLDKGNAQD